MPKKCAITCHEDKDADPMGELHTFKHKNLGALPMPKKRHGNSLPGNVFVTCTIVDKKYTSLYMKHHPACEHDILISCVVLLLWQVWLIWQGNATHVSSLKQR